ncbi:MAG: phosphoglucosamine mutase [Candidatus Bipolaricaulota bacterium]
MPRYFGTDGVRGKAGEELSAELAFKLGRAAGQAFSPRKVLLARDTRLSGPALAYACSAGLAASGREVHLGGVLPSPAVSHLVARGTFDLGAVISASHNPPEDNGVKFYGPTGMKLSPEEEQMIEQILDSCRSGSELGQVTRYTDAESHYSQLLREAVGGLNLSGVRVALDCAHGATAPLAPELFRSLGATVSVIGGEPDGSRINATGATHTSALGELVRAEGADIGIAYDGDGDRSVFVDSTGELVEGDRLMAALAPYLLAWGELTCPAVVFTVLGNLGAEQYLTGRGFTVVRVPVGDRHVAQAMGEQEIDLGGEPSGHIVFRRHSATGDGILTSLLVLSALRQAGCDLRTLTRDVRLLSQVRVDIAVADHLTVLQRPEVQAAIHAAESSLNGAGRLLVRPSGTQHLIRIMAEGPDERGLQELTNTLTRAIHASRPDSTTS